MNKRLYFSKQKENSASRWPWDWIWGLTGPSWVPNPLAHPVDFHLACHHNCMSQFLKIDLFPHTHTHTHFIDSVFLENSNTLPQQMPATLYKRLAEHFQAWAENRYHIFQILICRHALCQPWEGHETEYDPSCSLRLTPHREFLSYGRRCTCFNGSMLGWSTWTLPPGPSGVSPCSATNRS